MPKTSVEYVKQAVPAFVQRFKDETGYKEHQLSDKNRDIEKDKDLEDRDDERPQVVRLSKNDMTAEEAKKHWEQEKTSGKASGDCEGKITEEEVEVPVDGKVVFRKPTKRPSSDLDFNVSKKKKSGDKDKKKEKKEKKKGVKNKALLSFGDDDEET